MSKRKPLKRLIYDLVILIFPVMLGVYLGLLANNWNEAKNERKKTEVIMQNLDNEIGHNQKIIEESIGYFQTLADSIFLLEDKNKAPSNFGFWKGLNPPLLKNSSFQSAMLSGAITNFNIELIEVLSNVYTIQDDLKTQSDTYIQSITDKIGNKEFNNSQYLIILENYAHDQISSEEQLLEALKLARKHLEVPKN